MKYIKKFLIKESVDIEEVQDFCDNALAYLLDEGFEVSTYNGSTYISILLKIPKDLFYWSEYKDDIIPFIQILKDNGYEFTKLILNTWYFGTKEYTLNDVLNDKPSEIDNTNQLMNLNILIFKKPNERG